MTGKQLRALRKRLKLNQVQLADILRVSKGEVSVLEWKDKPVPAVLCERVLGAERLHSLLKNQLPEQERKRPWRNSKNFSKIAPFEQLPAPGTSCGCGRPNCTLSPKKDDEWPEVGRLWVFTGRLCRRTVYLNEKGQKVAAPTRFAGDLVPAEVCNQCGRRRELHGKFRSRLGCVIYTRYCRRRKGDPTDLKHDSPTLYWQRNGRFEKLPPEAIQVLRGRGRDLFPPPVCEHAECPRRGKPMERSGVRLGRIVAYKCPAAKPAGYAFRVLPTGEVVEMVKPGLYRWTDRETGQVHELRSSPAKRKARRARGRPRGFSPQTLDRAHKAAAFLVLGWSLGKMSPYLFPETPASAYLNTRNFFHDYRPLVESKKQGLTPESAQAVVDRLDQPS